MSYWTGVGGGIVVNSGTELPINQWTLRKNARLTENTTSGNTATNYAKVVPDYSWEVMGPWDDTRLPDTDEGMNEGDVVTVKFEKGTSGKFATLTNTTVETVEETEDVANDIIRYRASGKGGTLTRDLT